MATGTIPKYADGTDSDWTNTGLSFVAGTLYYRRIGSMCELSGDGIRLRADLDVGGNVELGTLPNPAKPTDKRAFFPANCARGYAFCTLSTGGVLTLYNAGTQTIRGNTQGTGDRIFIGSMYF